MEHDLLNKEELLEFLRVSRRSLDRMIERREFPFIKLGRRILFKKSDIEAWIETKKIG